MMTEFVFSLDVHLRLETEITMAGEFEQWFGRVAKDSEVLADVMCWVKLLNKDQVHVPHLIHNGLKAIINFLVKYFNTLLH